jgi:hypothetical protein
LGDVAWILDWGTIKVALPELAGAMSDACFYLRPDVATHVLNSTALLGVPDRMEHRTMLSADTTTSIRIANATCGPSIR